MKRLLLALSFLLSTNCASIPDVRVCVPLTRGKGWCGYTLSDHEQVFSAEEWKRFNLKMIRMPVEDFGRLKTYIIQQCLRNETCKQTYKLRIEDRLNLM